jgi:hypothetical protein
MNKKVRLVLTWVLVALCFGVHVYGAKSEGSRVVVATLYFKIDSAEISPESENELKKILTALEADPAIGLRIEGFGHQQTAPQKNREISQKRVQAVKQWFSKKGVAKNRLMTINFGDTKPAVQKQGAQDPAHGERVEILQVSIKQPVAFLPDARHQFEAVVEGQEVAHDFIVQNKGTAPLEIKRVKTD